VSTRAGGSRGETTHHALDDVALDVGVQIIGLENPSVSVEAPSLRREGRAGAPRIQAPSPFCSRRMFIKTSATIDPTSSSPYVLTEMSNTRAMACASDSPLALALPLGVKALAAPKTVSAPSLATRSDRRFVRGLNLEGVALMAS